MITAIIGAGGKTTLLHQMAMQQRALGKTVLVTTTTHMYKEPGTLLSDNADTIIAKLRECGYVMAGIQASEEEKIQGISSSTLQKAAAFADEVLIEADGARHMPLKFPADHEPVIPPGTDQIIIVCGLQALDHPAKDTIFRLQLAKKHISLQDHTTISARHIQDLVRKGYLEPIMKEPKHPVVSIKASHDGSLYQRALAALLEADLDVDLIKKEWFAPKPTLFICGGGHVSKELASMASCLDFSIHVIDSRSEFASAERFPQADCVICDTFDHLPQHLLPGAFYVVVTPGHQDDFTCVKAILDAHSYRYIGMIGSHKKVSIAIENLRNAGIGEQRIADLHAPIGLPIGAETPAEIAVSILAQIIQEKNKTVSSSISSELLNANAHGMLCIIIDKSGSTPRGIGSMMLVTKETHIDTIGGGIVEASAIKDARSDPCAAIREYHLTNDEGASLGMVCGGSNTVLFLPV